MRVVSQFNGSLRSNFTLIKTNILEQKRRSSAFLLLFLLSATNRSVVITTRSQWATWCLSDPQVRGVDSDIFHHGSQASYTSQYADINQMEADEIFRMFFGTSPFTSTVPFFNSPTFFYHTYTPHSPFVRHQASSQSWWQRLLPVFLIVAYIVLNVVVNRAMEPSFR